jgi:hypothetical protein
MADWISVKDRQPNKLETVLITGSKGHCLKAYLDLGVWMVDAGRNTYITEAVTHWMPLPDPPEDDDAQR